MTFNIYYMPKGSKDGDRGYSLFDIEYYREKAKDNVKWFSEIDCIPVVEGICIFFKDKLKDKSFDYQQFIVDATEIQEIRGLLYERFDNSPKLETESSNFHYNIFGKFIQNKFKDFADKYNLFINID